MRGRPW
jgi:hypothetical protein